MSIKDGTVYGNGSTINAAIFPGHIAHIVSDKEMNELEVLRNILEKWNLSSAQELADILDNSEKRAKMLIDKAGEEEYKLEGKYDKDREEKLSRLAKIKVEWEKIRRGTGTPL